MDPQPPQLSRRAFVAATTGVGLAGLSGGTASGGVETGTDVTGQVAGTEGNRLTDVAGTAIRLGTRRFLVDAQRQAAGPIQSNRISAAGTGIVVSGFTNRPVEGNELSDIDGTAVSVEGCVLAPIRTNSIDGAQRGIVVADGAEAAATTGNELRNVRDSEDGASSASTATPDSVAATTTPGDSGERPPTAGRRAGPVRASVSGAPSLLSAALAIWWQSVSAPTSRRTRTDRGRSSGDPIGGRTRQTSV